MLFNEKLDRILGYVDDYIIEDIASRMKHLVAQVNKFLKVGPNTSIHRYIKRSGIEPEPEQIVMSLAEYDPTENNGLYMPWIIKMVGQGLNLPEDGSSLYDALSKFHRIKRSPAYKGPTDIMKVGSLPELSKHLRAGESKTRAKANVSGWGKYIEVFLDTGYYKVLRFDPRPYAGQEVEIVATAEKIEKIGDIEDESAENRKRREEAAANRSKPINWILKNDATPEQLRWAEERENVRKSGDEQKYAAEVNPVAVPMMEISVKAGTVWCLASPRWAMQYLADGPLYFFYKDDGTVLFSSADNHFDFSSDAGGWVDIDNNSVMKLSPRYAMLLCKMIVLGEMGDLEQLHAKALKHIGALLKRFVRQIKNGQLPEWNQKRLMEKGIVNGEIIYSDEQISPAELLLRAFEITQKVN